MQMLVICVAYCWPKHKLVTSFVSVTRRRVCCSFTTSSVCRSTTGGRARRRAIWVTIIGCDVVVVGPVVVALSSTLRILLVISFRCVGSRLRILLRRSRAAYSTRWEANFEVVHNPSDLLLVVNVVH